MSLHVPSPAMLSGAVAGAYLSTAVWWWVWALRALTRTSAPSERRLLIATAGVVTLVAVGMVGFALSVY